MHTSASFSFAAGLAAFALAASSPARGQEPTKLPTVKPSAVQPSAAQIREQTLSFTVRLARPVTESLSFADGSIHGRCSGTACTVTATAGTSELQVCRILRSRLGPIESFARGSQSLGLKELHTCNAANLPAVHPLPHQAKLPAVTPKPKAEIDGGSEVAELYEAGSPPTQGLADAESLVWRRDFRGRRDDLRVVRIDPSSGEIASVSPGDLWTAENSILVTLEYDLASASCAMVNAGFRTDEAGPYPYSYQRNEYIEEGDCDPGNVPRGRGRVQKRLVLMCGRDSPERIGDLRLYSEMIVYPTGRLPVTRLVEKEQTLPHTILCRTDGITAAPGAAARLPDNVPPPSFEDRPPAARADDQVKAQDRPVSPPPAARADDVVRRPVPSIDPGVAKRPPPAELDPGVAERLGACPDPATVDLSARLVGRTDPSRGVGIIEIVGIVRNVGRAAYVSEPGQQSVELIEEQPGNPPSVVTDQTFTILAPNGTVRLVHRRGWDTSTEFQPRYRLRLVYDPDIRVDANPRNDDCGLGNNEAVLEPERINALFR